MKIKCDEMMTCAFWPALAAQSVGRVRGPMTPIG